MAVLPPARNDAVSPGNYPEWVLIGPALATIVGLALVTGVYRVDRISPIQMELGLSGQEFLVKGVVAYVIAAAMAFPLGVLLGPRHPTAVITSAICVMLVGVVLVALGGGAGTLLVGRVFGGLGAGAAVGVTTALLWVHRRGRGIAATAVVAGGVVAAVVAPFVNQLISDALSFRLAYLVAAMFLLVALFVSAISGIALLVLTRRPARPAPYAAAYPSPGFPAETPNRP